MPARLRVESPPVLRAATASWAPLVASRTRTVPLPVPAPPGEKSEALTTSEVQAVTARPDAAAIGPEVALPDGAKLTGACVSWTVPRLGEAPGVERRACQRTPWTFRRKFSASVGDEAVTGKYSDQNSFPPEEYGWRKLIQSATVLPLEVRAIWRKSRTVVEALPSWYVAQPLGTPPAPGGKTVVAWSPRVRAVPSMPLVQTCRVEPSTSMPVGSTPDSSSAKARRLGSSTTPCFVQLVPSLEVA